MIDRDTFESWPQKRQMSHANRIYSLRRKEVLQAFRDAGQWRDRTGKVREIVHHCWAGGQGHSTPWWYYFQYENLLPWSDYMHKTYHDVSRDKWTEEQKWEAEIAETIREDMMEDNRQYQNQRKDTSGIEEYNSVADIIKSLDE